MVIKQRNGHIDFLVMIIELLFFLNQTCYKIFYAKFEINITTLISTLILSYYWAEIILLSFPAILVYMQ